jgi:hypothetical protein
MLRLQNSGVQLPSPPLSSACRDYRDPSGSGTWRHPARRLSGHYVADALIGFRAAHPSSSIDPIRVCRAGTTEGQDGTDADDYRAHEVALVNGRLQSQR